MMPAATLWLLLAAAQEVQRERFEVYLCARHLDEQSTTSGVCPVCGEDLVLRFLAPSFSCPMHPSVDEPKEGRCRICGMSLLATMREAQWVCPGRPEILSSAPGLCPDGAPMEMKSVPMAHGDHNPRHGGVLFMAPNGYHHLEGTLDEEGAFRLYLYNDFTRPISVEGFEGRIEDRRMEPAPDGTHLVLEVEDSKEVVLHLRFPGEEKDTRFDFVFGASAASIPVTAALTVPEDSEEIYREILRRNERVAQLIGRGAWADLYIPALEAKDLVLALLSKEDALALPAKKLVRAAWLLDTHGDRGNRLEVESAYRLFAEAVRELEEARDH